MMTTNKRRTHPLRPLAARVRDGVIVAIGALGLAFVLAPAPTMVLLARVGLLDPAVCRVLARLTAFSAPFTMPMAEAVFAADEHVAGTPFAAVVGDLVDRSLLERRGGDRGAPRFRLPDDVSAAVCTLDPEGCATGQRQLAEFVLGLAQAAPVK